MLRLTNNDDGDLDENELSCTTGRGMSSEKEYLNLLFIEKAITFKRKETDSTILLQPFSKFYYLSNWCLSN